MDKMKNLCIEKNCIKCCLDTRMPLSNQDIKRINKLGFDKKVFVYKNGGWIQLRNRKGKCVFHNGLKCLIYKERPEGCRLYPIIYDKDNNCAIHDAYCPYKEKFKITKDKIEKLILLVSKLENEKVQRKTYE